MRSGSFRAKSLLQYLANCQGQIRVGIFFLALALLKPLCAYGICVVTWIACAEEDDEFYELQPADYFNLISNRMAGKQYGYGTFTFHIFVCT
jgi:hypothetical protein